jgi:ankyrin repeat protein
MQNDRTALAWAVVRGYANVARFLLENGATVDFEDEVRRTDMNKKFS